VAQTIKIKRSTGSDAPSTLAQGELAYSKTGNKFYVGDPATANTPIQINDLTSNASGTLPIANGGTGANTAGDARTNLGLGSLATLSAVGANEITDDSVGADELNVSGDGTTSQFLRSDGDGSFTWATPTDNNVSVANLQTALGSITTATTIGSGTSADFTFASDVTVSGDLTVSGTTTTINTEEIKLADNFILLNSDYTGSSPTENAGIEVNRGTQNNVQIFWDEANDVFKQSNLGGSPVPVGTITGITGGEGLNPDTEDESGDVTLSLDLSELTDMTDAVDRTQDELILLDNSAQRRKLISEIDVSAFDTSAVSFEDALITLADTVSGTGNGVNGGIIVNRGDDTQASLSWDETAGYWRANNGTVGPGNQIGTITGVTGGVGIDPDVEDTTGNVTLALDLSELTDMTDAMVAADEFIVLDSSAQKRKAASEIDLSIFSNATSGFGVGTLTGITISSTDSSISGTGSASSGSPTFDLEVATIDGGTY